MPETAEQVAVVAESAPAGGALPNAQSQQVPEAGRGEQAATAEPGTEAQQSQVLTSKENYEELYKAEMERRKKAEERFKERDQRAQRAEAEAAKLRRAKEERLNDIRNNPERYDMIKDDPLLLQEFIRDSVEVETERQDAARRQEQVNADWHKMQMRLMHWVCLDKDGPQRPYAEFEQWVAQNGHRFSTYNPDDHELAYEDAVNVWKGKYLPTFAERMQANSDQRAHNAAMQTLKHGNPPGSGSASPDAAKGDIADRVLKEYYGGGLRSPGIQSVADLFKK